MEANLGALTRESLHLHASYWIKHNLYSQKTEEKFKKKKQKLFLYFKCAVLFSSLNHKVN